MSVIPIVEEREGGRWGADGEEWCAPCRTGIPCAVLGGDERELGSRLIKDMLLRVCRRLRRKGKLGKWERDGLVGGV